MGIIIDAKGLPCPQPVMMTKKGLDSYDDITVIADNETAASNVRMFAMSKGCDVEIQNIDESEFHVHVKSRGKEASIVSFQESVRCQCDISNATRKKTYVFSSNMMGKGDDKLGEILLKAFIHTVVETDNPPDTVILYNSGVKLSVKGTSTADDLLMLQTKGVRILVCGTCVKYYNLESEIEAGVISNMYEIVSVLSSSDGIIVP